MVYLVLLLLLINSVISQSTSCQWICNDPVCFSECIEVCEPPICSISCLPDEPGVCNPVECNIQCPTDQNIDNCPSCETLCSPIRCAPIDRQCQIECEAVVCSWQCFLPTTCPYPICELNCEAPACEFSSGLILSYSMILFIFPFYIWNN